MMTHDGTTQHMKQLNNFVHRIHDERLLINEYQAVLLVKDKIMSSMKAKHVMGHNDTCTNNTI